MKQLLSITIPNFTNTIVISNKQQVKPYYKNKKTPKLPLKYSNFIGTDYFWDSRDRLVDKFKQLVPSNPTKAGTPRIWHINGQDIYNDKINQQARNNYMDKIKLFFLPYFEDREFIQEEDLELRTYIYVLDQRKVVSARKNIDNDNLWILDKATGDVLKGLIIKDDNPYVLPAHYRKTIFVEKEEEQKLIIELWK